MSFKNTEILYVIDTISREKSINSDELFDALEEVIKSIAKTQYGNLSDIDARLDKKSGHIELFRMLNVVTDLEYKESKDKSNIISITLARKTQPDIGVNDIMYEPLPSLDISRMSAYTAKKLIIEKLKELEIEKNYNQLQNSVGTIMQGVVRNVDSRGITILIEGIEGYILRSQMIKGDNFKPGDRMKVYLSKIEKGTHEVIMTLSRTNNEFLARLMKNEIVEIQDGLIEIKAIVRDPGSKAKIAVYAPDKTIDAVGACIGIKGSRIQVVISELGGERIDIVRWSNDITQYVINCFHPIQLLKVYIDETHSTLDIEVMNKDLSAIIGRQGQNIKLVSRLLGMNINVNPERNNTSINTEDIRHSLMNALDIDDLLSQLLISEGYKTPQDIIKAGENKIAKVEGLDDAIANELVLRSQEYIAQHEEEIQEEARQNVISNNTVTTTKKEVVEDDVSYITNEIKNSLHHAGITDLRSIAEMSVDELQEILEESNVFIARDKLENVIMTLRNHLFFNLSSE